MAFPGSIQAIVGTTVYNLNNGTSLWLEEADGLFDESPARRLTERGPEQHGHTDLGMRLDSRTITFRFNTRASSGAGLEANRDELRTIFQPTTSTPVKIRVTRDDGQVRQIDVHRTGNVGIPLRKEERPGYLNRMVVQVEAADPNWYDPTQQVGTISDLTDWWLAFNTIGTANVLEHTESPGTAQAWTYGGTVTAGNPWLIAVRSGTAALSGSAFAFESGNSLGRHSFAVNNNAGTFQYEAAIRTTVIAFGTSIMTAGTHNYFLFNNGGTSSFYRDTTLIATNTTAAGGTPNLVGVGGRWRASIATGVDSAPWPVALPKAAIYNIAPTPTQLAALSNAMDTDGTVNSGFITYAGDWPDFPVIRIDGPISDPIVTNTATGETLAFTGYAIGSGDYYTIDTRYGYKTILNSGGDNKIGELTSDSDLETFHLAPAPQAAGGLNILTLAGTATGAPTSMVITYYNRYTGF